jgi:PHD/YefM family antitoxin component YafN of YafNO toxin-antitoxin module
MSTAKKMHTQYITNEQGERVSVVIPVDEYEALLEDIEDLAILAERRGEESSSHAEVIERLKADGLSVGRRKEVYR